MKTSLSVARSCHWLTSLLGGSGLTGVVGFCLNYVVLFNFLLMGLTDLISCLRGEDNLVDSALTLAGEEFHFSEPQ